MYIRIDTSTGVPIWQQIVAQATRQALSGGLAAGERLPTVRELASELRVNPNTVARAYQELERGGVVETRRGSGTFAADATLRLAPHDRLQRIGERVDALIVEAEQLQVSPDELAGIVEERLEARRAERSGGDHGHGQGQSRVERAGSLPGGVKP